MMKLWKYGYFTRNYSLCGFICKKKYTSKERKALHCRLISSYRPLALQVEAKTKQNVERKIFVQQFLKFNIHTAFSEKIRSSEIVQNLKGGGSVSDVSGQFETEKKEPARKKFENFPRKPSDTKISDFLIRNIMSYPLHVPAEESEHDATEDGNRNAFSFTSVSAVLQETMSEENKIMLDMWKKKMILKMGEEQFMTMQADPGRKKKSKKLVLKNNRKSGKTVVATLNRGIKFHSLLKDYLCGKDINEVKVPKEAEGCWESVRSILPNISHVKLVEQNVSHPVLQYRGIVDCVASYNNTPCVIEWKQSEKPKKDLSCTYDAPVQVCAYMGTLSWCKKLDRAEPVTNAVIIVAFTDGHPASIFPMNVEYCQSYWEKWLRRLQQYWIRRSPTLMNAELS